jgi:hypothetical protein
MVGGNNMKKEIGIFVRNIFEYLKYGVVGVHKRKELVKKANKLREKGYNVLIDEENSRILYY